MAKCSVFICIFMCYAIMPGKAWAYLDPGTGSMVLQSITAVLFSTVAVIGVYWRKIKEFFSSKK